MKYPRRISKFAWALLTAIILLSTAGTIYFVRTQLDPSRIVRACATAHNRQVCYTKYIEGILRTRGIPDAFDVLAAAYDSDPSFAGTCHALTHELGKAAYDEFTKTGHTELTSKASYCGYGFYHGFMDALYVDTNDMEKARSFCTYVGQNVPHPPAPEFAEGSCYHGIGHGVTDGTDPRLWGDPIAIVKPGLALCEKVSGSNKEWHVRCVSGVFNALGNMYINPKFKLDAGTNPYTLCSTGPFSPLERETCYSQMNTQAAVLAHNDLSKIVGFANTIQDLHYRSVALHEAVSYYIQVLKYSGATLSPEQVQVCALPTAELTESCVSGFVSGIIEFGLPGEQYREIERLCGAEALPEKMRKSCYSALQLMSQYYFTADVYHDICRAIPEAYKDTVCRS